MTDALDVRAPAKVNLFLRILAREEGGFHQLETLFLALDLADELSVTRGGSGVELEVEGDAPAAAAENLAGRAAHRFLATAGLGEGVRIRLRKRIPVGAGLGGGSSDAGATLRALSELFGHPIPPERLLDLAAELGSDVPFFAAGVPCALAWGRGERLLPLPPPPPAPLLLALPPFTSPTPAAYAALATARAAAPPVRSARRLEPARLGRWETLAAEAENDFEPVLLERFPALAEIRDALAASGARVALLSGSGSALFALYADDAARDAALARLAPRLPARLLPARTLGELRPARRPRAGAGGAAGERPLG